MNYPVNCKKCNQLLYGHVKYCPFCGTAYDSVVASSEKENLAALRIEIDSSLIQGEYTPDIKGVLRQKGKEIGITDAAVDAMLLEALKEKGFSPAKDGANDPLAVEWFTADKKPKEVIPPTQPEPPTTEEPQSKPEKPVEVKAPTVTPPEQIIKPKPPPPPPPPPKPLFWKVAAVIGAIIIIAGLLYAKKESGSPPPPKTGQDVVRPKPQRQVEQPKKTRTEVPEAPKPPVEQQANPQLATTPNLDAERERIRQEAEKEVLARVEAERQRQELINRQREIENQRQEQAARQREIDDYLADGRRFFENGKYELCIEKMREVIRRDSNNSEARQYIRMASEKINNNKRQFPPPPGGIDTSEIKDYLAAGKKYFDMGKYELCISKMEEVLKRDKNHPIAIQHIRMANEKINKIKVDFENQGLGKSE